MDATLVAGTSLGVYLVVENMGAYSINWWTFSVKNNNKNELLGDNRRITKWFILDARIWYADGRRTCKP